MTKIVIQGYVDTDYIDVDDLDTGVVFSGSINNTHYNCLMVTDENSVIDLESGTEFSLNERDYNHGTEYTVIVLHVYAGMNITLS